MAHGTTTEIHVDAQDNIEVAVVEVYVDGELKVTFYGNNPFVYAWTLEGKPGRGHTISAIAKDYSGNQSETSIEVKSVHKEKGWRMQR